MAQLLAWVKGANRRHLEVEKGQWLSVVQPLLA